MEKNMHKLHVSSSGSKTELCLIYQGMLTFRYLHKWLSQKYVGYESVVVLTEIPSYKIKSGTGVSRGIQKDEILIISNIYKLPVTTVSRSRRWVVKLTIYQLNYLENIF